MTINYFLQVLTCVIWAAPCLLCTAELLDGAITELSYNKLCPYNNFCESNATNVLKTDQQIPCCRPCYCDDDCWIRGNCCPDKEKMPTKPPSEACQSATVKRQRNIRMSDADDEEYRYITRYYIIRTCPRNETNKVRRKKCMGKSRVSFEDFIWVTGLDNGKIYKNKFCAECHGVLNYTYWTLMTSCYEVIDNADIFWIKKTVPSNCSLTVVPPATKKDILTSLCTVPSISKCNVTGQWETYNWALENACNAFESHYLEAIPLSFRVYRNVFCYLCNVGTWNSKKDVCTLSALYNGAERGADTSTFSALLDTRLYDKTTEEDVRARICNVDEIHDPFQKTCRKLSCPFPRAPYYGVCRKFVLQTYHLGIVAHYRLDPLWHLSTITATNDSSFYQSSKVGTAIFQQFDQVLGLSKCIICEQALRVSKETELDPITHEERPAYFLVVAEFITNKRCQEARILNSMTTTQGQKLSVKIGGEGVIYFTIRLDKRTEYNVKRMTRTVENGKPEIICPVETFYNFAEMSVCPTVTFTENDYSAIMSKISDPSQKVAISALFYSSENNTVKSAGVERNFSVCFDDYMHLVSFNSACALGSWWFELHVFFWHLLAWFVLSITCSA